MRPSQIRKSLIIGLASSLASCSSSPQKDIVHCHNWTKEERTKIGNAVSALPDDSPLRWVDRDYVRICINIK